MIKVGTEVGWVWRNGIATGVVQEIYPNKHKIISKGKQIVRNGTINDPALVIRHQKGSLVIKLSHEVQELSQTKDFKTLNG